MKMKSSLLSFGTVMLGAVLVFPSCSKDDSTGAGKLSYQVKPTNFTTSVGSVASGSGTSVSGVSNLTWTSGNMNIAEIDFEAENNNVEIEHELKNLVNVNLFHLSPILGSITIPDGTYDEVELKLELKPSATAIPLTLKGLYTNASGVTTPVEFYFNEEFEIEVEAENLIVSGTNDYLGMINLQLNKFLTNVITSDLDGATKTDGKIIISGSSNTNLYSKFKQNFSDFGDCDFED